MAFIWISNSIIEWESHWESGADTDEALWKRSYEIWNRAQYLIENAESDFDRSDGILNLKRSLDRRLKLIENIYHLKDIDFSNRPKGYIELLGELKIVRPFILKKLLFIRNNIEHNDEIPPDKEYCRELLDSIWYFLKSTDSLVKMEINTMEFRLINNGEETQYWFNVDIENRKYPYIEFRGWFADELISISEKDEYFKVQYDRFEEKSEMVKRNVDKDSYSEMVKRNVDKDSYSEIYETDKYISGMANPDGDTYRLFMEKILTSI